MNTRVGEGESCVTWEGTKKNINIALRFFLIVRLGKY